MKLSKLAIHKFLQFFNKHCSIKSSCESKKYTFSYIYFIYNHSQTKFNSRKFHFSLARKKKIFPETQFHAED